MRIILQILVKYQLGVNGSADSLVERDIRNAFLSYTYFWQNASKKYVSQNNSFIHYDQDIISLHGPV